MVKTRPNKKPNKVFEIDYVNTKISRKVSKKKKPLKATRQLSPRGKKGILHPSSDSSTDPSLSPPRKRTRQSIKHEESDESSGLTIVFARKGRDVSISGKKSKSKKSSKSKLKASQYEDDFDNRSTSASFKRKGMDRESRADSPTRGIDEIDRIKLAIDEIRSGEATSVQKAAYKWRIHADKLYRRLKGSVRIDGRNGPPPVLSRAEEEKLTTWINTMSERGFPVSSGSLRNTVQNFLKQDKRDNPFTDDKPSMSWYKAFVRRNPKVKTMSSMMLTRSHKSIEAVLEGWYGEFDTFLRCRDIIDKPEKIWHFVAVDLATNTGLFPPCNGSSNVDNSMLLGDKVCTCIISGNAAGQVIPPFFVFRGHCVPSTWDPLVGAPLSSGQLFTHLGSTSKTMYSDWLENHFLPNVAPERPVTLLLDCPEGHIDVDVFVTAQQNDVHMFRILPSISDIICPISEDMLRIPWEHEAAIWDKSHPLVPVSAKNAARIVGKAWPKLDQPHVIMENFRKVGVYPVNKDVTEELLLNKLRRDREAQEAARLATLKPSQSIISLELFESKIDKAKREQFHHQLLSKESGMETEEYLEWKQLYEEVYGKIIPVQDVPIAEEEVTVGYGGHVVGHSEIIETQVLHEGEHVMVEVKEEYDPSQIILSTDLSSVPPDVINVALTMATDIATYRTESDLNNHRHQIGTNVPTTVANTAFISSAGTSCFIQDGGVVASTIEIDDSPVVSQSLEVSQPYIFSAPSTSTSTKSDIITKVSTSPSAGSLNQAQTIVNVAPVGKNKRKQTIVNVIRVTPGEKRDVSQSNIPVHQTTDPFGTSSASGVLQQVAMTASGVHSKKDSSAEEILPLIHISDTGEVSVVPADDARKEIVEVTNVVEVDGPVYPTEQVMQQIQVTELQVVGDSMPKETMMETNNMETEVVPEGAAEKAIQPFLGEEVDPPNTAEGGKVTAGTSSDFMDGGNVMPEAMTGEKFVNKGAVTGSIEVTTLPQALNANEDAPPQQGSAVQVMTVTGDAQIAKSDIAETGMSVVSGELQEDNNQAAIVDKSSENGRFDGLGNEPLMQGDVVVEEVPAGKHESLETVVEIESIVAKGDTVSPMDDQPATKDTAHVTTIVHGTAVGQEELSEILAPSDEVPTVPDANGSESAESTGENSGNMLVEMDTVTPVENQPSSGNTMTEASVVEETAVGQEESSEILAPPEVVLVVPVKTESAPTTVDTSANIVVEGGDVIPKDDTPATDDSTHMEAIIQENVLAQSQEELSQILATSDVPTIPDAIVSESTEVIDGTSGNIVAEGDDVMPKDNQPATENTEPNAVGLPSSTGEEEAK